MSKSGRIKIDQRVLIKLVLCFFLLYLLFHFLRSIKNSLFFAHKDRLNVVFYGERPAFLSFGLTDNVDYLAYFNHDFLVFVPGGYGQYRVGSLGKLANLEKKPAIIQNTFSSVISTHVDFYFYPKKAEVYSAPGFFQVTPLQILKINYQTNANFFDRVYLLFLLMNKRKSDFSELKTNLNEEDFFTKYQGYFYQKFLRNERKNLQIDYKNYKSAQVLNRIIEGEGIRVVDLTLSPTLEKKCQITERSEKISQTAFFLAKTFNCIIEKGDTGVGDIRIILGEKLEEEWE